MGNFVNQANSIRVATYGKRVQGSNITDWEPAEESNPLADTLVLSQWKSSILRKIDEAKGRSSVVRAGDS